MNEIKLCGIAICGVVVCCVFKGIKSEYSLFIRIIITVILCSLSFSLSLPILTFVHQITSNTYIYDFLPALIKILGIAIVTELTYDICLDANETSIGSKVLLFSKIEILILTLPLIKELFNLCQGLLE